MSGETSQAKGLHVGEHGKAKIFGFERPSLLEDLRNILREYPDNEQIFKEMLQNAEDAGAKTVKILSVLEDWTLQEPEEKKGSEVEAGKTKASTDNDATCSADHVELPTGSESSAPTPHQDGTNTTITTKRKRQCRRRRKNRPADTRDPSEPKSSQWTQEAAAPQTSNSDDKENKKAKQEWNKDGHAGWTPDFVQLFSMPGLCVYNDALFTDDDWRGIMKLHDSVKVKDPLKVGQFGLGFKSVFHMTDHPIIISGDSILFMDPFRDERQTIYKTFISDLHPESEERNMMHCALSPLLKVLAENSLTDKRFEGTVFWFPLRQKSSELSGTLYTSQRVCDLMQAFRSEINTMPLFLKRLEKIEVYRADTKSQSSPPILDFSVELNEECLAAVRNDREKFISSITTENKVCPKKEISVVSHLVLDTGREVNGQMEMNRQSWIVIHFHQGTDDMSRQLQDLCQRKFLTRRPYVGVAVQLNSPLKSFQGQLFSFLPLPPEKPSPTGLPVHIHGYFELSENRRHVDWPKSEEEMDTGPSDEKLEWNRLLMKEVLPRAYIRLVCDLVNADWALFGKAVPEQEINLDKVAKFLYDLCPHPDSITSHCQSLLTPFYQKMSSCKLFFTHIKGGQWVFLKDAVVMVHPAGGTLSEAAEEAVSKVYEVCEMNLVCLPYNIVQGLQTAMCQVKEGSTDSSFKVVCPENIISLMKRDKRWVEGITGEQKCLILEYLCLHDGSLFEELELLPLADGSFCSFCDHKVHVCRDKKDLDLFPGLHNHLCYKTEPAGLEEHLRKLADKKFGKLQLIMDVDIPRLLHKNVEIQYASFDNITVSCSDPWVIQVWNYLQGQDLTNYEHLPLLPCLHGETLELKPLNGNYLCANLKGYPPASSDLITALDHLGVYVIPSLPSFLHHDDVVHSRVQPSSRLGVLKCLANLSVSSKTLEKAVEAFNTKSCSDEREALANILVDGKGNEKELEGAKAVLCHLELFPVWPGCVSMADTVKYTSVQDNHQLIPENAINPLLPPVSFSPELLYHFTISQRQLASCLGAVELSLEDLVEKMLSFLIQREDLGVNSNKEVVEFMTYCLQSPVFEKQKFRDVVRQIHFVPSCLTRELRKVDKVYDPDSELLQQLFAGEDKFPDKLFCQSRILESLRQIGLRNETNVTDDDLLQTATEIDSVCKGSSDISASRRKANALWKFLMKNGPETKRVMKHLAELQCLPCVENRKDAPPDYPTTLPVCPEEYQTLGISSAGDMCRYTDFEVIASVKPVSLQLDVNHPVCAWFYQPTSTDIIQHLAVVTSAFDKKQYRKFDSVLHHIYSKLNMMYLEGNSFVCKELKDVDCIWTERDGRFRPSSKFWAYREDNDEELWPYRFLLPLALAEELSGLFLACGCNKRQDCASLRDVLCEMQTKYMQCLAFSTQELSRDFELAQAICKAIVRKGETDNDRGETLLPIYTVRKETFQFALAKDCTVAPDLAVIEFLTEDEDEESMVFVHPDFDKEIALELGALDLATKTKSGVNDLPVDDSSFGQYEPLTTRLHNLLRKEYTDGFSVPKELLQNADDAGATVVKFLVDERENRDWRTGLQPQALAGFQGAALWVYNDAEFSSTDFVNLCKLGGATKKEDCSKVGKFGLGFNAVYNITEIPSIHSGSILAALDPQEKYLMDKKRGKKMNFNDVTNRAFLKRFPNQFRPFQGVFGCNILNKSNQPFQGTLFRFPFRTEAQAEISLIRNEAFTAENWKQFEEGLKSKAGNLLMFLQNVTRLELYHLSSSHTDPSQAECLMILERKSETPLPCPSPSMLQHISEAWRNAIEHELPFQKINITETVTVSMTTDQIQECMFHVAWSTGQKETYDIAKENNKEGFVPLAAVGISVEKGGVAIPIEKCPTGFYSTGHLFCFLPLAEQVSESKLLVHINAPFALRSDRKGLLTETDDDQTIIEGRWNKALFQDPIPIAYLSALESVAYTQTPLELYYHLWPTHTAQQSAKKGSPQSELCPNFYRLLVQEEGPKVFLCENGCCGFSEAFFFDPDFKETDDGIVAFGVLKKFWKETQWHSGYLIDLPFHVTEDIRASGQESIFTKRVITKEQFFVDILFPKIAQKKTFLTAEERNQLVLHALLSDSTKLHELVKSHDCIPCQPDGHLQCPERLIHPKGPAAPLFTEEDGRFPQNSKYADFTSSLALDNLVNLGMVKDVVSREELLQQAHSLKAVFQNEAVFQRVQAIIRYLPILKERMNSYISDLSNVEFLPVQEKPKDWPLKWFGAEKKFEAPSRVFSNELKDLVGCQASILLEEPLDLSPSDWETLKKLGVIQLKAYGGTRLTETTVNQLISISEEHVFEQNSEIVEDICKNIYKHLNSFLGACRQNVEHKQVMEKLKEQPVVWTNQGFQKAEDLALGSQHEFEPYLVFVDDRSWSCRKFFEFLGVKNWYGVPEILAAMKHFAVDLCSRQLTNKHLECILGMANLVIKALDKDHLNEEEIDGLFLPDNHEMLCPMSELCLNDCDWLTESDTMHFLHPSFSENLALAFGVRTKREHDEDEFSEPFGQHEKLTNRINRLLEGYERGVSIFKELVQNADDAGASEIRFIKDLRCHNTEKLLNERWKEMFGPALCVFNDAFFTPSDMQGIQDLGEGSKGTDTFKTGKYGVGFNSVYNLTDTPSFWTRVIPEGDTSQVSEKSLGEKLCVMDPNFFVTGPRAKKPGQCLTVTDRFKNQYSNMLSPFLLDEQSTESQTGTVFRLPLRTEEKAAESKIKQGAVNMEDVQKTLQDFQAVMGECLLFLKNVKKIGVYTAKEDGTIEKEYETQLTADEINLRKHKEFFEHVKSEAQKLKAEDTILSLYDFTSKEITMQCCLSASDRSAEEWLVVHRFGLSDGVTIPDELRQPCMIKDHKLLPLGGVALCLSLHKVCSNHPSGSRSSYDEKDLVSDETSSKANEREFKAFCMLPLPVSTGLPVHVNGRFALDHETRGNIITQPDKNKNMFAWNQLLADSVIVPAYVTALRETICLCFSKEEVSLSGNLSLRTCRDQTKTLSHYSKFFPDHQVEMDTFWSSLMKSFYKYLAVTEATVFPAVRKDLDCVLWVPAVKSTGFPGYFMNLDNEYADFKLKQVLLNLNMNIIECPFRVYEAFVTSLVTEVNTVNEETVAEFLRSCQMDESVKDSCNLKHLPQQVKDTAFKCLDDVYKVFQFLGKKCINLDGLPLSLRMSNKLYVFNGQQPTIVSDFCDLLPGSSERFLHRKFVSIAEKVLSCDHVCLRKLDVKILAELLPETLDQSVFGCGEILLLDEVSLLTVSEFSLAKWIKKIWKLLTILIKGLFTDNFPELLNLWSFIPAMKDAKVYLFPFQKRDQVVHVSFCHVELKFINRILNQLPLNKLHVKLLPFTNIATEVVASVTKPERLLTALALVQEHSLKSDQAREILLFFFRTFSFHVGRYASAVRSLPFFERQDGSFLAVENTSTALCLPDEIPSDGLKDWCSSTEIFLLKKHVHLTELFQQLGISSPCTAKFYIEYLLPKIRQLPVNDIPLHMECIRNNCLEEVYQVLCRTPFIKCGDGTLSLASNFYSPYCNVFAVMMSQDQFPPAPYNENIWKKFLEKVGMVTEVPEDMFLRFAKQVAESGRNLVSDKVKNQSQKLVQYLKGSSSLRKESFLRHLKTVKFIVPQSGHELEQKDVLLHIHPLFQPPSPLVSFTEGLSSKHSFLVWTSSCILPTKADPVHFVSWTENMYEWIGFKKEPPLDIVVRHVVNICQALNRKSKGGISELSNFNGEEMDTVEDVMETIYNHLMKIHDWQAGSRDMIDNVKSAAVIFDKKKKAMFYPEQVIIGLRPDEEVEGYVMCAPEVLGKFFNLFRKLGVDDKVRLDHCARALERISSETRGSNLNPNELHLVAIAVDNLFKLLRLKSNKDSLSVRTLYLPGEDITQGDKSTDNIPFVRLVASKDLILEVNETHKSRLKTFIEGLVVFVNFEQHCLEGHDFHREVALLPEQYKMQEWRDVVKETVQESCRCLARSDSGTQRIQGQIHSSEFALVVKRLVNHARQQFTEDDAVDIERKLHRITVLKTTDLKTVLSCKGSELPDTKEKRKFFVEKVSGNGHTFENVFLYIDSQEFVSYGTIPKGLLLFLHMAVEWAVGCEFPAVLSYCFEDLASATGMMDDGHITPYRIRQSISIVFPPPGSFVPDEFHFMLDQDVYEFKVSEVVAHELHDPILSRQSPDSEDSAQVTPGSSSDDHNVRKPIYIFAKVLKVIEPHFNDSTDARTRLLRLRYEIDVGQEEVKEVEACELYKFVRPGDDTTSMVPYNGDAPFSSFSMPEGSSSLKETLKEIRRQLRQIWQTLKDTKSRMRALKRLYLVWHPDKNPDRKDFCTTVFQNIMRYVEILEQSGELDSDGEDNVDSNSGGHHSGYSYGGYWSSFFDDLSSRASSYSQSSSRSRTRRGGGGSMGFSSSWCGGGSFSFSSHTNPQPEEGKRWLRQAEKDLEAAREMLQHTSVAFNWVCYQAHQAAEKALKAVLYHRDSGHDFRNSHSIYSIASYIEDESVQKLSASLEDALGHHTQMRYPGFRHYPKIPSEIYCETQGKKALKLAEEIVMKAQSLLARPFRQPAPPPPQPQPQPQRSSSPRRSYQRLTASPSRQQISSGTSLQITAPQPASQMKALPPPP